MSKVDPKLIEGAASSVEGLLRLLIDGLDWPIPQDADLLDDADLLLEWDPAELQLDPTELGSLTAIRQIAPLTAIQPFGVFVLTFEGGRLPIGALRRVVRQLVRRRRRKHVDNPTWELGDLLFFCHNEDGQGYLHIVAMKEDGEGPSLRTISWSSQPTPTRRALLSEHTLPDLCWPEPGTPVDNWRQQWRGAFTSGYRQGVRTADQLSQRMSEVASDIRDEINDLLAVETPDGALHVLLRDMQERLDASLDESNFGDVFAQTLVYGLLSARISHPEQFQASEAHAMLDFENPFLDAVYGTFRARAEDSLDLDHLGLVDLAHTLAATDIDALLADFGAGNRRDDPVIYLYEEFLEKYDPRQRRELGTYYTPIPVVSAIVRLVDEALRTRLGFEDGIADQETWAEWAQRSGLPAAPDGVNPDEPVIGMIDPATGTGTFLLSWLRTALAEHPSVDAHQVLRQMSAIELSMASYAVAHLKLGLELPPDARANERLPIYLSDALAGRRPGHFAELADPIAEESSAAEHLRLNIPRTVVIGNPPYLRTSAAAEGAQLGGMIRQDEQGRAGLIKAFTAPLAAAGGGVHAKNLYNLYVYFWRWAVWKTCEQHHGPAVVGMITASSFLTGPGFAGMREVMRKEFDEIWIIDLGGEGRGARRNDNVFDKVMTPVCITLALRAANANRDQPATVNYQRLEGSRSEKFARLAELSLEDEQWQSVATGLHDPLAPGAGGDYAGWPLLTDLFPWQHSGAQLKRTWPISPARAALDQRWAALVSASRVDRVSMFKETRDRKIVSRYPALHDPTQRLEPIADLPSSSNPEHFARYAYRSFDRQWCIADNRVGDYMRPPLWESLSDKQIFMTSLLTGRIGDGPAAVATPYVPDLHHFRGSYGAKHVIPLYRDAAGTPNIDSRLLTTVGEAVGVGVTVEDLFAYCYGVLGGSDYASRFAEELETPGPRIPITNDTTLFREMADHGRRLLRLHTWGERFQDGAPAGAQVHTSRPQWAQMPTKLPQSARACAYDADQETLRVADGLLTGVPPVAWEFEVSGMKVLPKWLAYRTVGGAGRAASSSSSLDGLRPTDWPEEWSEELIELVKVLRLTTELMADGAALLEDIVDGPTIDATSLPEPAKALRNPPGISGGSQGSLI